MKRLKILLILFLFYGISFSQYLLKDGYIAVESFENVKNSFSYKNLRLYPLKVGEFFIQAHKNIGNYLNLEEALKENKIKITETIDTSVVADDIQVNLNELNIADTQNYNQVSNQDVQQTFVQTQGSYGQVNTLFIQNLSEDTIFLMAGEVIKGGKQDRVLAKDLVLLPGKEKIDLSVFCVESHRWSFNREEQSFDKYYSISSNSVRYKVSKAQDQSQVWEAVDQITSGQNAESSTGTYTALEQSSEFQENLKEYSDYFLNAFDNSEKYIGFVGVSGDKIIGCDIFATENLFRKQLNSLLSGYITEALTNGDTVDFDDKKLMVYLNEFLSDENTQDKVIDQKGIQLIHKKNKIHITIF